MVNLRINWTLYTGEVKNLAYQGRGECLFIYLVYHKWYQITLDKNLLFVHYTTISTERN